jgi:hypothetical protein
MIEPSEIDPTIQGALKERLAQIFIQQTALDPLSARVKAAGLKAWRETAKQYAARYWGACGLFASSLLAMPVIAPTNEGIGVLTFLALNGLALGLVIATHRKVQGELSRYVSPELMRGAAHLVALSRAEIQYCEAVAALVDAGATLGETTQKEILAELNGLLESHRKLELPVKHYRSMSGSATVATLEQELAQLALKRDGQADPAVRATMDQSVAMCGQRLEHARRIEPLQQQAEAQQEFIVQTMASIQGSLSRIAGAGANPLPTEVAGLRETVHRVHQQTRSVEDAVAELQSLGVGV